MSLRCKTERLAIAAHVAPRLREGARRNIKVVGADGQIVREITDVELAQGVLDRAGIEFDADPDRRRSAGDRVLCPCGRPFVLSAKDRHRTRCSRCQRLPCAECGEPATSKSSMHARSSVGSKPYCAKHRAGWKTAAVMCCVCGEPATRTSAANARNRGSRPYCAKPRCRAAGKRHAAEAARDYQLSKSPEERAKAWATRRAGKVTP